jgi:hypothetical protein
MKLASLFFVLFLVSCRTPDSVGIGANASQFDMLGYNSDTFLDNQMGNGFGMSVWAEWQIGKKKIDFEWPDKPAWYITGDKPPATTTVILPDKKEDKETSIGEDLHGITKMTKTMRSEELVFWLFALIVLAGLIVGVGPKLLHLWKDKKDSK